MDDNIEGEPSVFYIDRNIRCTKEFGNFVKEYTSNLDFFFFIIHLVARADENRVRAAKALITAEMDPEKRAEYERSIEKPNLVLEQLSKHSTVQSRNLTTGIVNAFQRYFSSIINAAALKRPEMISSSQSVRIDDILKFTRHRDLVAFIVDRKINELSYGGLNEMEAYFGDRLGVKMFNNKRQRELLRFFVEVRNINSHNGGVVNDIFLGRVGDVEGFPYKKGKPVHVDMDALVTLSENAVRVAMHIDKAVSKKFGLKLKKAREWTAPNAPQMT